MNGEYDGMTAEELERALREAFFYTDRIDDVLSRELEGIREALERKRPTAYLYTPEEAWERFRAENPEALESLGRSRKAAVYRRTGPALLRLALIAAAVVVLLAGVALAADSLGLVVWTPKWNGISGRYEPVAAETDGKPIPAALAELGITEPVYPARLPEGFTITESHISTDPVVLMEQYVRGKERLSITVTPIKGFETAVYQKGGGAAREYDSGEAVHYVFETENTVTAMWYTRHYATTISGNISRQEIKGIIDSIQEGAA